MWGHCAGRNSKSDEKGPQLLECDKSIVSIHSGLSHCVIAHGSSDIIELMLISCRTSTNRDRRDREEQALCDVRYINDSFAPIHPHRMGFGYCARNRLAV